MGGSSASFEGPLETFTWRLGRAAGGIGVDLRMYLRCSPRLMYSVAVVVNCPHLQKSWGRATHASAKRRVTQKEAHRQRLFQSSMQPTQHHPRFHRFQGLALSAAGL